MEQSYEKIIRLDCLNLVQKPVRVLILFDPKCPQLNFKKILKPIQIKMLHLFSLIVLDSFYLRLIFFLYNIFIDKW